MSTNVNMGPSPLLVVERLRKRFGARQLFDIAHFTLDAASAYVLTGVNGAGKSTLLRVLAGLEEAEPSALAFDGQAHMLAPYPGALRAAVAYVHQHPIMFSTSVAHNIGYGLLARGVPAAQVRSAVAQAMAWAGVAHLQDSDPARLSGGEKQRVALAPSCCLPKASGCSSSRSCSSRPCPNHNSTCNLRRPRATLPRAPPDVAVRCGARRVRPVVVGR